MLLRAVGTAFWVVGCGGPPPNSFSGPSSFTVPRAIWSGAPRDGGTPPTLAVTLSSAADVCELLKMKVEVAPEFQFELLGNAPGPYQVINYQDYLSGKPSQGRSIGSFVSLPYARTYLTDGSVKVDALVLGASPMVKGSFDVKFADAGATGTFEATPCPP